jgi:hypothetical protein
MESEPTWLPKHHDRLKKLDEGLSLKKEGVVR